MRTLLLDQDGCVVEARGCDSKKEIRSVGAVWKENLEGD